jgi:hypothetical protein
MASESPNCPDCSGPIGADWDWCMHCGYDPDHLKPWDWRPSPRQADGGSVQTMAPGQVDLIDLTDRKRTKRAVRSKRKGRSRKDEHAEPRVETMATTHSLITLPPRPSAPTASAPPLAPAPPAARVAPAAGPAPTAPPAPAPVRPEPPMAQPVEARRPEPQAAPARPEARAAAFDMTSPLATPAPTRPTPQASRTISLPRSPLSMAPVFVLFALAALMLFVAVSSMGKLSEGTVLSRATTVLFVLVCLALACGMAAQAYAFRQVRVEVSSTEVIAHNRFGRPCKAQIRDIFSVKLGSRRYLDVPVLGRPVEAPYVQMQDGSGFWLDALEGRSGEPPTPDQLAVVDWLARSVAANRNGTMRDDAPSNLI